MSTAANNDAILIAEGLSRRYRHASGEVEALREASLRLSRGSTAAIVGPSGSGKSTLLSLIAGLDHPDSGRVVLAGQDLATVGTARLAAFRAQMIGIVFQQFHLLSHLTATENVALPLRLAGRPGSTAMAEAARALGEVGLSARRDHRPGEMSGGECQRVAIARALITRPPLLLADEPSGNLDARTGTQVMDLLFKLAREHGTTLLLVTHNDALAARCQRRFLLDQGRLMEIGG